MMMLAPTIKKHSLVFNPGILAMERYAGDSDLDWFITKTYLHPKYIEIWHMGEPL